jgi:transposase
MRFIGIDLHSDRFTAAAMEIQDRTMKMGIRTYSLQGPSWRQFLQGLGPEDYLLVEASTNSFWFHDQVAGVVKTCYVYNTNDIHSGGNKTDKIDAKLLAKKLAYSLVMGGADGKLPTVYVPDQRVRELRALLTTLKLHGKMKTALKNRIHTLLRQNGICIAKKDLDTVGFATKIGKRRVDRLYP